MCIFHSHQYVLVNVIENISLVTHITYVYCRCLEKIGKHWEEYKNHRQSQYPELSHYYYIHFFLRIFKEIKIKTFSWTHECIFGPGPRRTAETIYQMIQKRFRMSATGIALLQCPSWASALQLAKDHLHVYCQRKGLICTIKWFNYLYMLLSMYNWKKKTHSNSLYFLLIHRCMQMHRERLGRTDKKLGIMATHGEGRSSSGL